MTGHSNVVEEAMQTFNDSGDLLRQVRGIHCTKCGLRRCELLSYRNGIKGMEWWNVWVRAAEALSRPCRPGGAAPFGDDGVRVRACACV